MGRRYGKDGKERQGKALAGWLHRMSAPVFFIFYFLFPSSPHAVPIADISKLRASSRDSVKANSMYIALTVVSEDWIQ